MTLRLLQERTVYLNHIYQLAASARSVVAENKMLRLRLEATKQSATLVRRHSRQPCWPKLWLGRTAQYRRCLILQNAIVDKICSCL